MEVTLASQAIQIQANDLSQAGFARRQAIALATSLKFTEAAQGRLGIIVTEASRNITIHSGSEGGGADGEVILTPYNDGNLQAVDVLALDRGTGMADIGRCMVDGYSTSGTTGGGLGAISRLADVFDIYSASEKGTAVLARVFGGAPNNAATSGACAIGCISIPITGESVCGDAWHAIHEPERSLFMAADGLGHGPIAAEASEKAVQSFLRAAAHSPEFILNEIHGSLAKTRGAAVSVVEINPGKGTVSHAGIGNISAAFHSGGKTRTMVSLPGTVGHTIRKIQQFSYPWERDSLLIMHSDGLQSRWGIEQYPGLALRHPALIAGVLYRDHSRRRDDATILVTRL